MIRAAIAGYGNLGKGAEYALMQNKDFVLTAIFTRRNPSEISPVNKNVKVDSIKNIPDYKGKLDVLFLCGGSAADLPATAPELLKNFNCIDSFDTHAKIPAYLKGLDVIGKSSGTLALVSAGWDPGLFSLARAYFEAFLPAGVTTTFWGGGVSQGHSDAIRRIAGVKYGIQYTIPKEDAVRRARAGETGLTTRDKHLRRCYVVADENDRARIKSEITGMPDYFSGYDTEVSFITEAEFIKNHSAMPHGGLVLRNGKSANGSSGVLELNIKLDSNPEFTGSILVAYGRALYRLAAEGRTGALTVFDVAPSYLMPDGEKAVRELM